MLVGFFSYYRYGGGGGGEYIGGVGGSYDGCSGGASYIVAVVEFFYLILERRLKGLKY